MPNMSYCRFENTASDLEDCWDHWDDEDDADLSSNQERRGKRMLRKLVLQMAAHFEFEDLEDED
jgi:hypothetical protein